MAYYTEEEKEYRAKRNAEHSLKSSTEALLEATVEYLKLEMHCVHYLHPFNVVVHSETHLKLVRCATPVFTSFFKGAVHSETHLKLTRCATSVLFFKVVLFILKKKLISLDMTA